MFNGIFCFYNVPLAVFFLVAHQVLLRGQTLWPRNMPKGCGNRTLLKKNPYSLAFAFGRQLNKAHPHVGHNLIDMYNPSLHH